MARFVDKPYLNTPVKAEEGRGGDTMEDLGGWGGGEVEMEGEGEDQLDNLFKYWNKQPQMHVPKAGSMSLAMLDKDNNCHRCGKKVYPVEKVDIGVLYHKGCFKCRVCARQLTFQTFQREVDIESSRIKEVYCNTHVPRQAAGYGQDALGIRSALDAQKRASRKIHRHVYPDHHYVPKYANRGSGHWYSSGDSDTGSVPDPEEFQQEEPEIPSLGENKFLQDDKTRIQTLPVEPEEVSSEHANNIPEIVQPEVPAVQEVEQKEEKGERDTLVTEPTPVQETDDDVKTSLLRRRESVKERNSTIRRRSTLRSFQDFEKHGVFDAQSMLEKAQREEEDQLYSQIDAERRTLRHRLDDNLRTQRDYSIKELMKFFEQNDIPENDKQEALVKIEEYYRRRREAALRSLLQRLAAEEQSAVARMVEKHSNEMIQLIRKKDRLASQSSNTEGSKEKLAVVTAILTPVSVTPVLPTRDYEKHSSLTTLTSSTNMPPSIQYQNQYSSSTSTTPSSSRQSYPTGPEPRKEVTSRPASSADDFSHSAFTPINSENNRTRGTLQFTPIPRTADGYTDIDDVPDVESLSLSEMSEYSIQSRRSEVESGLGDGLMNESSESLEFPVIPEAEPPECRKSQLFTNPDVFKEQDRRAIEESKKDHKTFTDLVRQLSRRCQTELQKVRSIFRWITVKDLNRMKFDEKVDPDSPLGLLRGIKKGTESYHDLFRRLCSYAGLHCEIIEGYSKGAGYRPGAPIAGDTFRNQWTAVWVDGSWRFINCKWGARHVKATRDINLTYKCDEFYFLTDPEDHIYQHFPDNPEWQLLKEPLHLYEFINLPVIKSPFFNNRLSLALPYDAVLVAAEGQTEVKLTSPQIVGVAAKLKSTNRDIPSEILLDRTLVRYSGPETIITVNLPSPGTYFLDIYASTEWDSGKMDNACSFQVTCSGISRDANLTYPQVGSFGPTPGFAECGLSEDTHTDPYIVSEGQVYIKFHLTKNVSLRPTLRRYDPRDRTMTDYDRYALYRQRTSHIASFDVQLPRRGLFLFSIYVTNPDDPSSAMVSIYKYLIDCKSPKLDSFPYPKASKRFKHCRVVEPLCGDLTPETEVMFRFESRRAVDMMVVFNNKSHGLKVGGATVGAGGNGNGGKVWEGKVYINVPTGKVMLYSRFESSGDKYIPMLEYQISARRKNYTYVS